MKKTGKLALLISGLALVLAFAACQNATTGYADPGPSAPPPPPPGSTPDNPSIRVESIYLGSMISGTGWGNLLIEIDNARKYVALDLSGSTMTDGVFAPGRVGTAGKPYIVSLILPDVATSIVSPFMDSAFYDFDNLREITGKNLTSIGDRAFGNTPSLTSIILGATPPTLGLTIFNNSGTHARTVTFYVPNLSAYTGTPWTNRMGHWTATIGSYWDSNLSHQQNLTVRIVER